MTRQEFKVRLFRSCAAMLVMVLMVAIFIAAVSLVCWSPLGCVAVAVLGAAVFFGFGGDL